MSRFKGGFTLIEILVALIILSILTSLAYTTFTGLRLRHRYRAEITNIVETISAAERSYREKYGTWFTWLPAQAQAGYIVNGISIEDDILHISLPDVSSPRTMCYYFIIISTDTSSGIDYVRLFFKDNATNALLGYYDIAQKNGDGSYDLIGAYASNDAF